MGRLYEPVEKSELQFIEKKRSNPVPSGDIRDLNVQDDVAMVCEQNLPEEVQCFSHDRFAENCEKK